MVDQAPRLRVVEDGEEPPPPPPDRRPHWWRSPAVGVVLGAVVLLAGLGFGIWFLFARDASPVRADVTGTGSTNAGPPVATTPPTTPPRRTAPSIAPTVDPARLAETRPQRRRSCRSRSRGRRWAERRPPGRTAPPTAGSVGIRLFNGFTPGETLDVWEMSGAPAEVRVAPLRGLRRDPGTGPAGADGRRAAPAVRPAGGDPNATPDAASGPWNWNLVPTAGSRQTLVLVDDGGLHITRIDDRRAGRRGETRVGPRRADRAAAADRWQPRAPMGHRRIRMQRRHHRRQG